MGLEVQEDQDQGYCLEGVRVRLVVVDWEDMDTDMDIHLLHLSRRGELLVGMRFRRMLVLGVGYLDLHYSVVVGAVLRLHRLRITLRVWVHLLH